MRVGWRFRNGKYTSERTAWSSVTSEEGVLEAVITVPSAIVPALLPDKSLDNVFYQNRGVNQEEDTRSRKRESNRGEIPRITRNLNPRITTVKQLERAIIPEKGEWRIPRKTVSKKIIIIDIT